MRKKYLVLLLTFSGLIFSCHKDHNTPPGPPKAPVAPVLTTVPVTNITDTTATSGGTFTTDGTELINFKGIQWDTNGQFPNHWTASAGTGTGNFAANLNGLLPNTLYYVRAYAGTDTTHTWYGNTVQFTTSYLPGKYLVSTIAGTGAGGSINGDTSIATFNGPLGVAVDPAGNIYVADGGQAIRKVTPSGMVSQVTHTTSSPQDVVADAGGNVYVAVSGFQILEITPAGQVSVFAGSGQEGLADGTGTSASFWAPITLTIDPAGNLYVGDIAAFRKITPAGVVSTLTNYFSTARTSRVIGVDNHFNLYESDGYTVIKVDSSGNKTFLAGTGKQGNTDGTGLAAAFGFITELRVDAVGNIFAADALNNKIRMITQAGVVTTIAGTGAAGARDGNSAIATFSSPLGLAIDNAGNIIVADAANNKIRKISPL
jgi:hypothetical protein